MKRTIFFFIVLLVGGMVHRAEAQNEIRYADGIFRPGLVNPAYKWNESLLELDAAYRFPWEKDRSPKGGMFNLHSDILGLLGVGIRGDFYSTSAIRNNNQIGVTLDYGWKFTDNLRLKVGAGAGVNMERYDFSGSHPDFNEEIKAEDYDENRFYAEVGAALKFTALTVGISAYSYFDDYYMVFANARYDLALGKKWTISPLVSYSSYKDLDDIFDGGVTVGYKSFAEIGLAYSTNSVVHLMAHGRICKCFHVYYNCGIGTSDTSDLYKTLHEVGVRFVLGKK